MTENPRVAGLREKLASAPVDALLVTEPTNVRYLSGFTGDSSYLLISERQAMILSDRRYETQIEAECPGWEALIRGPERTMIALLEQALPTILSTAGSGIRLGLEAEHVSWQLQMSVQQAIVGVQLVPTSGWVESLRQIKDAAEVAALRRAVWVAQRAFEALRARLRHGWTELEMAHEMEATIRLLGGSGCGFPPILAIDANAALPHAQPSRQTLADASILLVDWGARVGGYTSDLTRMLCVGEPTPVFARVYEVVLEAQLAALAAIGPGVPLKEVDGVARRTISDAGFGEHFGHGLGHGIGLQVHEGPRIASVSDGVLQPGMVVTVEPGIYLPGQFGVRIEDDVLITDEGCEVLSSLPKGLDDCAVML